jgi:hypothetical protein
MERARVERVNAKGEGERGGTERAWAGARVEREKRARATDAKTPARALAHALIPLLTLDSRPRPFAFAHS